jgi:Phage portal protein/ParB/Sulfiredoxin domain
MIMRALKAVAPAPSAGGFGNVPAPYAGPGPSPLVASYNQWDSGHAYGGNAALPRDWATFLGGMFGPSAPIQPVPIDIPKPGDERPEPRRNQYPISWDLNLGMPGTEGWGKLADFSTLRTISDLYSVARQCIELRKAEIRGIGWDIAPTRHAAKAMRGDHKAAVDFAERQAKAVKFFRKPDPDYADLSSWLNAILEDFFVTDALAIYPHPPRAKGGGLFGSEVAGLDLIDGTLIKPLINVRGGKPLPPSPCYQQYGWGVPRVDLMSLLTDQFPDMGEMVDEFSGDQLLYLPYSRRSWTVYGQSWIERAIIPVLTGIQKQNYQLQYFSEGSVPGLLISAGDSSLTPSQLRELQDALNSLSGDPAWKHKIIVLPSGSKADPMRPGPLADDFDTLIQIECCMVFDVQPFEIGIIPQLSAAAASSGTARQTVGARVDIRQRKSTIPLLLFLKAAIFDRILQDVCGMADMEWRWEGLDEDENVADLTTALVEQVGAGLLSIDEGRQLLGRDPWGLPITSDPGWATQWGGLVPLTGVTEATAQPLGGSPGPGGPGRAAARPGAVDFTEPGAVARPGAPPPPTVPRNRMSTSQRRGQAHQVTATQNRTGSRGTPAHSGARAGSGPVAAARQARTRKAITAALNAETLGEFEEAGQVQALEVQRRTIAGEVVKTGDVEAFQDRGEPVRQRYGIDGTAGDAQDAAHPFTPDKAGSPGPCVACGLAQRSAVHKPGDALRELGLLKAHLRRGGTVGEWAPRDLPGHVLAMIDQDMAAGLSAEYACTAAKAALSKATSGYTLNPRSGMISLDLPEGALEPLPGGVTDFHVTVVYLGPDVDDDAFGKAAERARVAAAMVTGPLTATIGGIGSFPPSDSSDGKVPVFAQVNLPGGNLLRGALEDLSASEHAGWAPHVTLAYQDAGDPLPDPLPPTPVTFTHLTVHRGTDTISHPLGVRAYKDAADLTDPSPVEPEHVKNQMRRNYPEKALGWIDGAHWAGPVLIPQDRIDDGDEDSWAASHQPARVKEFAREIKHNRGHLHPVVAVQEPGESTVKVIDGHHRVLAYRRLGRPVKAYVGFVDHNGGPWDETHVFQFNQGAAAANKSEETPRLVATPHPLGTHSLWHTPDVHTRSRQKLPNYIEHIAAALMRDHDMGESEAIATAINAARAFAAGHAFGGKVKVTSQVRAAAQDALNQWEKLKASHH